MSKMLQPIYEEDEYYDEDEDYFDEIIKAQEFEIWGEENDKVKFLENLKEIALYYTDLFFIDKSMHCGGKIPKILLHAPQRLSTVMNTNIKSGAIRAYECIGDIVSESALLEARRNGDSTEDIIMVNESLKCLSSYGIPKQFAGGLMLLYLEFCQGVKVTY